MFEDLIKEKPEITFTVTSSKVVEQPKKYTLEASSEELNTLNAESTMLQS